MNEKPTKKTNQPTQKLLKRRGLPFAAVEHLIIDDQHVSKDALVIYLLLCRYADWNTSIAFPSVELIRTRLKMRKQDIVVAIKELEECGYLKVHRRTGKKSIYEVGPEVSMGTGSNTEPHQFQGGTGTSSEGELEQEISNNRQATREERHRHGLNKHVLLTDSNYAELCERYGKQVADEYIQKVDDYCENHGKTYSNYANAVHTYIRNDAKRGKLTLPKQQGKPKCPECGGEILGGACYNKCGWYQGRPKEKNGTSSAA